MAYNEKSLKREHRKQWRSIAKRVDPSCRNHGSCPWCAGGRMYKHLRRKLAADYELEYYENENN